MWIDKLLHPEYNLGDKDHIEYFAENRNSWIMKLNIWNFLEQKSSRCLVVAKNSNITVNFFVYVEPSGCDNAWNDICRDKAP